MGADGICPGCERPMTIHSITRWATGAPWRAYCRSDLTLESPVVDQALLEQLANGDPA